MKADRLIRIIVGLYLTMMLSVANAFDASGLPDFTPLAEEVGPAVVNISTTQKLKRGFPSFPHGTMPNIPEDSPFHDFFRRFFGDRGGEGAPEYDAKSLGSGFIIDDEGYILTNRHVINEADQIIVRLSDRREFEASVVGSDKRSDVALLKIDAEDLPSVMIGHPAQLKVGEWVLAIGSPFGFDHTVTAGIVSAKGRSLPSENYIPFIQTDVAINPGNSGGPLLNMKGEVVGVNAQIFSQTGGFMGLAFSIPIDIAMEVVEQLKDSGRVSRGWLGILIQDVTRDLAESFEMNKPVGALVARVLPDSPAEEAGFQVGDIIVEFNGHEIADSASLPPIVGRTKTGKKVSVNVIRAGKNVVIEVTIAELPSEDELASGTVSPNAMSQHNRLGVVVKNLSEEQSAQIGQQGVLVSKVEKGPAQLADIREGDIILMINGHLILSVDQFTSVVEELPVKKSIPVLVRRGENQTFRPLRIEEE